MDISKLTHADRSEVLVQALPYIQQYHNKTVVIKYGGNAMINDDLQDAVMTDIVLLRSVGINVVLVHGGGPEISEMLTKIGKESKFVRLTKKQLMLYRWYLQVKSIKDLCIIFIFTEVMQSVSVALMME